MPNSFQLYYITDRNAFPGDETARHRALLDKIAEACDAGIDYIQLREKDLPAEDLETLAREAVRIVRRAAHQIRLLINSRMDVALAVEADGVHLRSEDISPHDVAAIQSLAGGTRNRTNESFLIAVSCHSLADVHKAEQEGTTFAVLGPIFGKQSTPAAQPLGLDVLKTACQGKLPVFALGGLTLENARNCLDAGASGIAAIRLFQNTNIQGIVRQLRS
jgi:thiamine-phosphate pyrophosphorylase